MSLATRLSMYFLAALAAVLVGSSACLYVLGRSHLYRQLDDHLEKALDTLEAAVDIETDGLEWEPRDRRLTLGIDPGIEHVRWVVQDVRGVVVDRSANLVAEMFPPASASSVLPEAPGDATVRGDLPGWRLARRHLRLTELLKLGRGHDEDDTPEDDVEYPELILTTGLSPEPVAAGLRWLTGAVVGVSATLWLICAALGRWLCRRALAPLLRMAADARVLASSDRSGSIPSPGTSDELEDLGRAFNELLDRRQGALERQARFAGDASHQLRTPLAGLLSLVEVTRRRPRPAVEYEQALDQVHHEANRLRQIIESLLFLARSEAEAAAPEGEPINLATWIPAQVDRWSGHARAADLRCEGDAWSVVRAHPPLLAQALENLVDNALKYSEPGMPVVVSWRSEAGQGVLDVSDHGRGMSPEEAASAFEPFYRSPEARRLGRSGVGLGLSVVQRILAASGGSAEIDSRPGQGTRVSLRLPALAVRARSDLAGMS